MIERLDAGPTIELTDAGPTIKRIDAGIHASHGSLTTEQHEGPRKELIQFYL